MSFKKQTSSLQQVWFEFFVQASLRLNWEITLLSVSLSLMRQTQEALLRSSSNRFLRVIWKQESPHSSTSDLPLSISPRSASLSWWACTCLSMCSMLLIPTNLCWMVCTDRVSPRFTLPGYAFPLCSALVGWYYWCDLKSSSARVGFRGCLERLLRSILGPSLKSVMALLL